MNDSEALIFISIVIIGLIIAIFAVGTKTICYSQTLQINVTYAEHIISWC